MRRSTTGMAALAAMGLALMPALGLAAPRDVREHRSVGRMAPDDTDAGRGCVALCDNDLSPCDPIQFKAADGRCQDPFNNR